MLANSLSSSLPSTTVHNLGILRRRSLKCAISCSGSLHLSSKVSLNLASVVCLTFSESEHSLVNDNDFFFLLNILTYIYTFDLNEQFKRAYTSVVIVPTGVGAAIGGYAGDALPFARTLSTVVDCLITHPNVC